MLLFSIAGVWLNLSGRDDWTTVQHELNPRSGRVHAVTSQRAQTGPLLSATAAALQFLMLKADIHANSELTHAKIYKPYC